MSADWENLNLEKFCLWHNAVLLGFLLCEKAVQKLSISCQSDCIRFLGEALNDVRHAETRLPFFIVIHQRYCAVGWEEDSERRLRFLLAFNDSESLDIVTLVVQRLIDINDLVLGEINSFVAGNPNEIITVIGMIGVWFFVVILIRHVEHDMANDFQTTALLRGINLIRREWERFSERLGYVNLADIVALCCLSFLTVIRDVAHRLLELRLQLRSVNAVIDSLCDLLVMLNVLAEIERAKVLHHVLILRVESAVDVFQDTFKLFAHLGSWNLTVGDDVLVLANFAGPERAVGVSERGVGLFLRPALRLALIIEGLAVRRR